MGNLHLPAALPHQAALWGDQTQDACIALVGPLGCGKSYALAVKALLLARANAGIDGMLVVPTYPMAKQVHCREWPGIWAGLGVNVKLLGGETMPEAFVWPEQIRSQCWIRSAESPERLAGPNLSFVLWDEPGQMRVSAWERGSVRPRHPLAAVRQNVLGGTPEGLNWFADLFANPVPPNKTIRAGCWHANLAHYPAMLKARYGHDNALLSAYAKGQFVPLRSGRAYSAFDRAIHASQPTAYDPHLPLVLACDFNVDAMRWLIAQVMPGEIRILEELDLGRGGTTIEGARQFMDRWSLRHRAGEVWIVGDASGRARRTNASRTDYQILVEELGRTAFRSVSLRAAASNPPVKERVDAVNYYLSGRQRTIVIDPSCRELILDFERVLWREGGTDIDKSDPLRTHASDALGYLVTNLAPVQSVAGAASVPMVSVGAPDPILEAQF